jgi:hypothetical protein
MVEASIFIQTPSRTPVEHYKWFISNAIASSVRTAYDSGSYSRSRERQ